jgi:PAS domain S-box-containing protein
MKFYHRLGYQKKLLIFMMSMVIFVGSTMGLLIRFVIFPHLTHEMERRGISVAERLSESTRTFILNRDRTGLTASLFEEKHLEKNIAYILVTDHENQLLAHTLVGRPPASDLSHLVRQAGWTAANSHSMAVYPRGNITDIVAPIFEGLYQIGTIRVGLDNRFISSVINRLSLFHLGCIGFITLVSLLFAFFLSRIITKPITSLTRMAGEISLGNLDAQIDFNSRKSCWEMLRCKTEDCPAYKNEKLRCWFVDDTPCRNLTDPRFPQKLEGCRVCPVYRTQSGDEIMQLADTLNHMTECLRISEARLRCSEQNYRLLFNSDPNPVFVVALHSHAILDVNDRAAEKYSTTTEQLVGTSFIDLGFPEDAARISAAFSNIGGNGKQCAMLPRIRQRRRDGGSFWVNIYFCSYDHQGEPSVITTTTDITEIIEVETRLIQAGKMATLGEMSAGIAHELNQPLNAIKVGSDFLQEMIDRGKAIPQEILREVAQSLSQEVDRAAAIINHLRMFGRKTQINKQRININGPIQGVFTMLGQQLKVHGITLVTDLDPALPSVMADENRIEQVLINLINNARDAMEANRERAGSPAPSVLTVKSFLENDCVVVTVSDTGTGIPSSIQERIFEPFFTTKGVGKGTGLGLSISYGIVRDYDGAIDFASEEGVGTTFRLSFPRAPDQ